ncbi:MAG: sulfotransferase [Phormidium sp.]
MVKPIQLMIVGAAKAGTTSLLRYLAQHPEIHTHSRPEMTFFLLKDEFDRGYDEAFTKYFGDGGNEQQVIIAKNPSIMHSDEAVQRLYIHNPNVNIALMLRNPIDRAYSAYWFSRRRGWDNGETFEEAIQMESKYLSEGWLQRRMSTHLYNSTYYEHIIKLLDQFGKEKVHVFLLEDLKANPIEVCQKIFGLLNIDASFSPDLGTYNKGAIPRSEFLARIFAKVLSPKNTVKRAISNILPKTLSNQLYKLRYAVYRLNEKPFTPPPMNPETRRQLVEHFRLHNLKLSELLGRDLSQWNH